MAWVIKRNFCGGFLRNWLPSTQTRSITVSSSRHCTDASLITRRIMSSNSPVAKRACTRAVIVTHSGSFHADEALAIHMLRILPEYKDAEVVRSRDPNVWTTASVLVDVGAEYDPSKHKYDHHQREFQDTFSEKHKTRLSSAGLVYKHFGKRVLAELLQWDQDDARLDEIHVRLYEDLIEAFDGIDNGVNQYPRDVTPTYRDATNLSNIVSKLNPFWNEDQSPAAMDEAFQAAVRAVGSHFDRCAQYVGAAWLPARSLVLAALRARMPEGSADVAVAATALTADTARARGHVVVLDAYCPWKDHLLDAEKVSEAHGDPAAAAAALRLAPLAEGEPVPVGLPLYAVFPDAGKGWRVQAVPLKPDSFENRKPLPAAWRGLRDANLDAVTGVPGGVFIHASGFIGGHATREGAIRLAELAAAM